jgi:hypothetical protein
MVMNVIGNGFEAFHRRKLLLGGPGNETVAVVGPSILILCIVHLIVGEPGDNAREKKAHHVVTAVISKRFD